ncbi:MAG: DUF192 domain-containing protein [Cyanobacteria bacterium]|nr:DUF192 domain-containing protein [Cyanobacteriota bacterium]
MGLLALGSWLLVPPGWARDGGVSPPGLIQPPQYLPITPSGPAVLPSAIQHPAPCLALEVPATERQYAWGLQMRPPLPPLHGMWFAFQPPNPARFWMHRTLAPLDIVFVRAGGVASIEAAAPPCPRLPCPSYGSGDLVDGVVEIGAGEAARLGIRVGTPVEIRPLP